MGMRPNLDPTVERKLKEVKPDFYPHWNNIYDRWEVWGKQASGRPYMVTPVWDNNMRPILVFDNRTYSKLRKAVWDNNRQYLESLVAKEEERQKKLDIDEKARFTDMAKDLHRPMQMLARESGLSSGKLKIPYSTGYGKGTTNEATA